MALSERQTEIIDTSIKIIAQKGIQGLTIKNLSKEIVISEPAIYRHFKSKTDILVHILDNFRELGSFMGEMMINSQSPAMEKIEFMFSRIMSIFIETPSYISVIFSEEIFKNEEELKEKVVEIMNQNEATIEHIIKSGQENGEIRNDIDVKDLALIVMGSLRFKVKMWDLKASEGDLMAEGNELIANLRKIIEPLN